MRVPFLILRVQHRVSSPTFCLFRSLIISYYAGEVASVFLFILSSQYKDNNHFHRKLALGTKYICEANLRRQAQKQLHNWKKIYLYKSIYIEKNNNNPTLAIWKIMGLLLCLSEWCIQERTLPLQHPLHFISWPVLPKHPCDRYHITVMNVWRITDAGTWPFKLLRWLSETNVTQDPPSWGATEQ